MEGKPRYQNPDQPYVVIKCADCNQNTVVTASGITKHVCLK